MTLKRSASAREGPAVAWALTAVSSDVQADTLAHQRAWAEEAAKAKGWRLERVLGDESEGVGTGKHGPRAIVNRLLAELRAVPAAARPSWLLVIRADRLGRGQDIVDNQIVLRDLKRLGVSVWTRGGEKKADTAMEQLVNAVEAAVAAQENEVRRDKATAVYKRKRSSGQAVGNKRPYGLKIGSGGRDEPDPERADVVRQAFALRCGGAGYHAIGLRLAAIAPPHVFKNGRISAVRWTPTRVKRLLENRGYVTGGVLDEVTFLRAQRASEGVGPARAQARHAWPLSGSIRCFCGAAMTGIAGGKPDRRIRYYACRRQGMHTTTTRLVRADDLETQFVALLARLKASPQSAARYRLRAAGAGSARALEKSLTDLRAQADRIKLGRERVWEMELGGKMREDDLRERLQSLADRAEQIAARIADVQGQLALVQAAKQQNKDADVLISRAVRLYERGDDEERRAIVRAVALDLGGLCVEEDGKLDMRRVEDPGRQRKRHHGEV